MILVDHALGHRRGRERQAVTLDHSLRADRDRQTHRRGAKDRHRPARGGQDLGAPADRGVGRGQRTPRGKRGGTASVAEPARRPPAGPGERAPRLAERGLDRLGESRGHRPSRSASVAFVIGRKSV